MKKKLIALACMVSIMATALVGCGSNNSNDSNDKGSSSNSSKGNEIALVTATGTIDDKSFNQGSWEGVKQYAEETDIAHKYYSAIDESDEAIINAMELAVKGGAKIVICPGYYFEVALGQLQTKYPDVTFVMLDGTPTVDKKEVINDNVAAYLYAEQEAGFLAGYAAVKDGYRKLGFMGGIAIPSVVRFGYGYVQGAEYAAKELGLSKDEVEVKYTYVGNFDASPDNMAIAATWYNEGTEVIFACGGSVGNSVMKAASTAKKAVIGVDVDQSSESDTVITSAMKNISKTVYDALTEFYAGTLKTGVSTTLNATTESVMLPMDTSSFKTFTQEDYEAVYKKVVDGEVTIDTNEAAETADQLNLEFVKVVVRQ